MIQTADVQPPQDAGMMPLDQEGKNNFNMDENEAGQVDIQARNGSLGHLEATPQVRPNTSDGANFEGTHNRVRVGGGDTPFGESALSPRDDLPDPPSTAPPGSGRTVRSKKKKKGGSKASSKRGSKQPQLAPVRSTISPFAMTAKKRRQVDELVRICREGYNPIPSMSSTYPARQNSLASISVLETPEQIKDPLLLRQAWDTTSTRDRATMLMEQKTREIVLERDELKVVRRRRDAAQKGKAILGKLDKYIKREDFDVAATAAQEARRYFKKAKDIEGVVEADALQVKVVGEQILKEVKASRARRDYTHCVALIARANDNYRILSGISVVRQRRSGNQREAALVDRDRHFHEQFSDPQATVKSMAVDDAVHARSLAAKMLSLSRYSAAKSHLEVARECFAWAGVQEGQAGIKDLERAIEVAENRMQGDHLLEKVATVLEPIVVKDFDRIFEDLGAAKRAYSRAGDEEGATIVERVRATACAIRVADRAWRQMTRAIQSGLYGSAVGHLSFVRSQLAGCTAGLPTINPGLALMVNTLLQPSHGNAGAYSARYMGVESTRARARANSTAKRGQGEVTSYHMIEEFALADGIRHSDAAEVFINEVPPAIEKADHAVRGAYECLRWVISSDQEKDTLERQSKAVHRSDDSDSDGEEYDHDNIILGERVLARFVKLFSASTDSSKHSRLASPQRTLRRGDNKNIPAHKTLRVKAMEALARVETLDNKITCARALAHTDTLMELYQVEMAKGNTVRAKECLDKAYEVYRSHSLTTDAERVDKLRTTLDADCRILEVEGLLKQKQFIQAIGAIEDAMTKYDKAGESSKRIKVDKKKKKIMAEEVMMEMEAQLEYGKYDDALAKYEEGLMLLREAESKSLMKKWGSKSAQEYVSEKAYQEGERFKNHAVQAIQQKELQDARAFSARARKCFEWADMLERSGIDEIDMAIRIAELFWQGEDLYMQSSVELERGNRSQAMVLIREAKRLFSEARIAHGHLTDISTSLMSSAYVDNALHLQEQINEIYTTSIDLSLGAEVENTFRCLEADISLDTITMLLSHEMFPDARALLTCADKVYKQAGDDERSCKVEQLQSFVSQYENYCKRMQENDFNAAVDELSQLQKLAEELRSLRPLSILSPEGGDWSSGVDAHHTIRDKAKTAGESDMAKALKLFEDSQFDLSLEILDKVRHAFAWVARTQNETNWEETSGINQLRKKCLAGKAQAEGDELLAKGKELMEKDEYEQAIQFFADSQAKFALGEHAEREEEVRCLGAVAQGLISFKQAQNFYKEKEFQDCLSLLGMALVSFEDGKNQEKQKETKSFQARVKGDQVMQAYQPALDQNDYDKAVEVLVKASDHYKDVGEAKLVLTPEEAQEQVAVVARRDGEKFKNKAQVALSKRKTDEVRHLITNATACFVWVGSDLKAAGIMNIQKDLAAIELKEKAENDIQEAFLSFKQKGYEKAESLLQDAHTTYRSADAFSQVNQTFAISLCLKADVALEEYMSTAETVDNAKLLDLLINAEEVFSSAQSVKGKSNGSWPAYLKKKYSQLEKSVAFFQGWSHFSGSNTGRSQSLLAMDKQYQELVQFKDQWLLPFSMEHLLELKDQCEKQYSLDPRRSSLLGSVEGYELPGAKENTEETNAEGMIKDKEGKNSSSADAGESSHKEEEKDESTNAESGPPTETQKDEQNQDAPANTKHDEKGETCSGESRKEPAKDTPVGTKNGEEGQKPHETNEGQDAAAIKIQSKVRQRQAKQHVSALKQQGSSTKPEKTDASLPDSPIEISKVTKGEVSHNNADRNEIHIDENSEDIYSITRNTSKNENHIDENSEDIFDIDSDDDEEDDDDLDYDDGDDEI